MNFHEWFYYKDGDLYWKKTRACKYHVDTLVGSENIRGYIIVHLFYKKYRVHNIIWQMFNGEIPENMMIDHKDGNPSNNNIDNLRLATNGQNKQNCKISRNNTSGIKGLTFHEPSKRWLGRIMVDGKRISKYSMKKEYIENWLLEQRGLLHKEFANNG